MMYGLVRPTKGKMRFEGFEFTPEKPQIARQLGVGMVFQHFNLYPHMTVLENVTLAPIKVLKQDPRPSYKKQRDTEQHYGMTLYHFNIKWTVNGEHNHVTEISQLP
jgi:ABC-type uncharacterized transport system ATPase subunit